MYQKQDMSMSQGTCLGGHLLHSVVVGVRVERKVVEIESE